LTQIGNCSRNPRLKRGDSTAATQAYNGAKEATMDEDVFNGSIRKFLKTLGVSAQREIEKAVRQAVAEGRLKGNEKFPATATVTVRGIGLSHEVKGEIELE
jgi:DNA-binding SARP family transcriptional activator